jgi:LuxR family maltose regulon positive regulatory protein
MSAFTLTGDDVYMGRIPAFGTPRPDLPRGSVVPHPYVGPEPDVRILCDAILDTRGSTAVLEQMEARNLLLIPLDRQREWYRYHHLLRDLLRSELRRREPALVDDLHVRAAAWFEANAMPEAAIGHAQAAADYNRVARLILELIQPVWVSGRVETVTRWMEWIRDITSAEYYGAIAAHGS